MKVLIIGGSGFIGTHLTRELLRRNISVCIFDKKNSSSEHQLLVTFGDVRDETALKEAMRDTDIVVNLAAEHRDDVRPISLYYDVNVGGAENICRAAKLSGVNKIIFTSTVAVYGLNAVNPSETSPTEPFNDYGKSKLQAETIFRKWANSNANHSLVIIRPVVIFGEGNKGNVYNLIQQIFHNRFVMVGNGKNRKSMGYVGNLVNFFIFALNSSPGIHIYNYADKPDMTVQEIVTHVLLKLGITRKPLMIPYVAGLLGGYIFDGLSKITGKKFPINSIRIRKFCATTTVATTAIESIINMRPYSLTEGLNRMIEAADEFRKRPE